MNITFHVPKKEVTRKRKKERRKKEQQKECIKKKRATFTDSMLDERRPKRLKNVQKEKIKLV